MSEFLADEDPEPQSRYPVNYETGLAYEGYDLSDYYAALQEKEAVGRLSVTVDAVLKRYKHEDDGSDCYLKTDEHMLRRRMIPREVEGRVIERAAYWFVDRREDTDYCRSWSIDGDEVNWCHNEERHEPAADVMEHILQVFPMNERPVPARRSMGAVTLSILAKLQRTRPRFDTA